MIRVLIFGATGMLGSTIVRYFSSIPECSVAGTIRGGGSSEHGINGLNTRLITNVDALVESSWKSAFDEFQPDVAINCIGVVKQLEEAEAPHMVIPLNSVFPHLLARHCSEHGARLIHVSTDCVFSGSKGEYKESDTPDARDLYGVSKRFGEVNYSDSITLRTSIIGHELNGNRSLIDWFLSETSSVRGFSEAVFSGLPTVEIARIINDYVIPNKKLCGVYHVSADPINKYDLLKLVSSIYGHGIEIVADNQLKIDRSLDCSRFQAATGYSPASWHQLITKMKDFG